MDKKTYTAWKQMKQRCDNPNSPAYKYYGGRGISYVPAWQEYANFQSDMGDCPSGLTLERINNDENYCLENCAWVSWEKQSHNRRVADSTTTGYLGVSQRKNSRRWRAHITHRGTFIHLGYFAELEAAVAARKQAEQHYWGT